ncbi:hypothetical protein QZH41_010215, partial [Actinostola sp. cb2023]
MTEGRKEDEEGQPDRIEVCRHAIFHTDATQNKLLFNHTAANRVVMTEDQCRIQCYMNHDCVSYNLGPSPTPGMLLCQLNNADRYQYPLDYQDKPGYFYRGTE